MGEHHFISGCPVPLCSATTITDLEHASRCHCDQDQLLPYLWVDRLFDSLRELIITINVSTTTQRMMICGKPPQIHRRDCQKLSITQSPFFEDTSILEDAEDPIVEGYIITWYAALHILCGRHTLDAYVLNGHQLLDDSLDRKAEPRPTEPNLTADLVDRNLWILTRHFDQHGHGPFEVASAADLAHILIYELIETPIEKAKCY